MVEKFKKFENQKPVSTEASPDTDKVWTRDQIEEMMSKQEEGRLARLTEARQRVFETTFSQANYMKDALELTLEPDQLARFRGFFNTLKSF